MLCKEKKIRSLSLRTLIILILMTCLTAGLHTHSDVWACLYFEKSFEVRQQKQIIVFIKSVHHVDCLGLSHWMLKKYISLLMQS